MLSLFLAKSIINIVIRLCTSMGKGLTGEEITLYIPVEGSSDVIGVTIGPGRHTDPGDVVVSIYHNRPSLMSGIGICACGYQPWQTLDMQSKSSCNCEGKSKRTLQ